MAEESAEVETLDFLKDHSTEIAGQVSQYSYLIADSLYLIVLGMIAVFLLHKLASRFLYRFVNNSRLIRVIFGALYVLVLVITILLALRKIGLQVDTVAAIAFLVVMVGAVVVYFLLPFFPRLPFMPGHMIETGGVMGTVDAVSTFHTTVRKFDGTMAFLPNALVLASRILNYSDTPTRRIEMNLTVTPDSDLDDIRERLINLVAGDERVMDDPAPAVFAMNADATGIQLTIYCWTENADYLAARSDLWLSLIKACRDEQGISLALPRQQVQVVAGAESAQGQDHG